MKPAYRILIAVAVAFAAGLAVGRFTAEPGTAPSPATRPALTRPALQADAPAVWPVVRIVDGDTAIVRCRPPKVAEERLRLLRIDTPERGQPGFRESTEALKKLLAGGTVRLEFEEPGTVKRDNFGRLLVYVYVDGKCVNVELVRQGWSAFETRYGEGRLADDFREAEAEAKARKRGLWADRSALIGGQGDSFVPSAPIIHGR